MNSSVGQCIEESLQGHNALESWTADDVRWVKDGGEQLVRAGFGDGDEEARREMHETAFKIFLARHVAPWGDCSPDVSNPIFATFLWVYGKEWDRVDRERAADLLASIPSDPEAYPAWITEIVQSHRSNVGHPLFHFLAHEASFEQLREMVFQETPFDLFFADILSALLPGIYGEPKMEIADNFWDEMGAGNLAGTHRQLRVQMMERLDLPVDPSEWNPDDFLVEELELANAYFLGTVDRRRAVDLIGMLMATESMVPGRLQQQISGWRRVGLADEEMIYLLEHTVVDVEHAEHWMAHVVQPIIRDVPRAMIDLTLGAWRRLELAAHVCDRLVEHLATGGLREPAA